MEREYPLKLSIIVPVYNVEKYVERCLLSLLNQDIPKCEYEIIVVDDGTPDKSAIIAQSIAEENENIIIIHRENGGLSAARNTGLDIVHGQYVFFVDSDDYIEENVLSKLLNSAIDRDLELLAFSSCRRDKNHQISWIHTFSDYVEKDMVVDGYTLLRKKYEPTSVWTYIYRTKMLNNYSFRFKEGIIHEDIEFNYRVFTKAKRIGSIDKLVYNYCWNDGQSITKGRSLIQEAKALISNMEVAASIKSYIRQESIPKDIFYKYDVNMNSMLIAQIYSFFKGNGRNLSEDFVENYFSKSKVLCVYPIKGECRSYKAKVAKFMVNIEPILMYMLRKSRKRR